MEIDLSSYPFPQNDYLLTSSKEVPSSSAISFTIMVPSLNICKSPSYWPFSISPQTTCEVDMALGKLIDHEVENSPRCRKHAVNVNIRFIIHCGK